MSKLLLSESEYKKLINNLALKRMGYNRRQRRRLLREASGSQITFFIDKKDNNKKYAYDISKLSRKDKEELAKLVRTKLNVSFDSKYMFSSVAKRLLPLCKFFKSRTDGGNYVSGLVDIHHILYHVAKREDPEKILFVPAILGLHDEATETAVELFQREIPTFFFGAAVKGIIKGPKALGVGIRSIYRALTGAGREIGEQGVEALAKQGDNFVKMSEQILKKTKDNLTKSDYELVSRFLKAIDNFDNLADDVATEVYKETLEELLDVAKQIPGNQVDAVISAGDNIVVDVFMTAGKEMSEVAVKQYNDVITEGLEQLKKLKSEMSELFQKNADDTFKWTNTPLPNNPDREEWIQRMDSFTRAVDELYASIGKRATSTGGSMVTAAGDSATALKSQLDQLDALEKELVELGKKQMETAKSLAEKAALDMFPNDLDFAKYFAGVMLKKMVPRMDVPIAASTAALRATSESFGTKFMLGMVEFSASNMDGILKQGSNVARNPSDYLEPLRVALSGKGFFKGAKILGKRGLANIGAIVKWAFGGAAKVVYDLDLAIGNCRTVFAAARETHKLFSKVPFFSDEGLVNLIKTSPEMAMNFLKSMANPGPAFTSIANKYAGRALGTVNQIDNFTTIATWLKRFCPNPQELIVEMIRATAEIYGGPRGQQMLKLIEKGKNGYKYIDESGDFIIDEIQKAGLDGAAATAADFIVRSLKNFQEAFMGEAEKAVKYAAGEGHIFPNMPGREKLARYTAPAALFGIHSIYNITGATGNAAIAYWGDSITDTVISEEEYADDDAAFTGSVTYDTEGIEGSGVFSALSNAEKVFLGQFSGEREAGAEAIGGLDEDIGLIRAKYHSSIGLKSSGTEFANEVRADSRMGGDFESFLDPLGFDFLSSGYVDFKPLKKHFKSTTSRAHLANAYANSLGETIQEYVDSADEITKKELVDLFSVTGNTKFKEKIINYLQREFDGDIHQTNTANYFRKETRPGQEFIKDLAGAIETEGRISEYDDKELLELYRPLNSSFVKKEIIKVASDQQYQQNSYTSYMEDASDELIKAGWTQDGLNALQKLGEEDNDYKRALFAGTYTIEAGKKKKEGEQKKKEEKPDDSNNEDPFNESFSKKEKLILSESEIRKIVLKSIKKKNILLENPNIRDRSGTVFVQITKHFNDKLKSGKNVTVTLKTTNDGDFSKKIFDGDGNTRDAAVIHSALGLGRLLFALWTYDESSDKITLVGYIPITKALEYSRESDFIGKAAALEGSGIQDDEFFLGYRYGHVDNSESMKKMAEKISGTETDPTSNFQANNADGTKYIQPKFEDTDTEIERKRKEKQIYRYINDSTLRYFNYFAAPVGNHTSRNENIASEKCAKLFREHMISTEHIKVKKVVFISLLQEIYGDSSMSGDNLTIKFKSKADSSMTSKVFSSVHYREDREGNKIYSDRKFHLTDINKDKVSFKRDDFGNTIVSDKKSNLYSRSFLPLRIDYRANKFLDNLSDSDITSDGDLDKIFSDLLSVESLSIPESIDDLDSPEETSPEETSPEETSPEDGSSTKKGRSDDECRAEWVWSYGFSKARYNLKSFNVPAMPGDRPLDHLDVEKLLKTSFRRLRIARIHLLYLNYIKDWKDSKFDDGGALQNLYIYKTNPWHAWQACSGDMMYKNEMNEKDFPKAFGKIAGDAPKGNNFKDYIDQYSTKPQNVAGKQEAYIKIVAQFAYLHDRLFSTSYYYDFAPKFNMDLTLYEGQSKNKKVITEQLIRKLIREKLIWGKK